MLLDITNNFSRNVNMDPETGKHPCVSYLIIEPDKLSEQQVDFKLANFELNIDEYISEIKKDDRMSGMLEKADEDNAEALFFSNPADLSLTNIKGFELCIIDENKNKMFYGTEFKINRGDRYYRVCGESQFLHNFIIIHFIGDKNSRALLRFLPENCVYKDIDLDTKLLNGSTDLRQYHPEKVEDKRLNDAVMGLKQIDKSRFDYSFLKQYFNFKDYAVMDEK